MRSTHPARTSIVDGALLLAVLSVPANARTAATPRLYPVRTRSNRARGTAIRVAQLTKEQRQRTAAAVRDLRSYSNRFDELAREIRKKAKSGDCIRFFLDWDELDDIFNALRRHGRRLTVEKTEDVLRKAGIVPHESEREARILKSLPRKCKGVTYGASPVPRAYAYPLHASEAGIRFLRIYQLAERSRTAGDCARFKRALAALREAERFEHSRAGDKSLTGDQRWDAADRVDAEAAIIEQMRKVCKKKVAKHKDEAAPSDSVVDDIETGVTRNDRPGGHSLKQLITMLEKAKKNCDPKACRAAYRELRKGADAYQKNLLKEGGNPSKDPYFKKLDKALLRFPRRLKTCPPPEDRKHRHAEEHHGFQIHIDPGFFRGLTNGGHHRRRHGHDGRAEHRRDRKSRPHEKRQKETPEWSLKPLPPREEPPPEDN